MVDEGAERSRGSYLEGTWVRRSEKQRFSPEEEKGGIGVRGAEEKRLV